MEYYDEVSNDALSIRGFQEYRCNDYHLGITLLSIFFHVLVIMDIPLDTCTKSAMLTYTTFAYSHD